MNINSTDIHERLRAELREQNLSGPITLEGNQMLVAIATEVLGNQIGKGTQVTLMSMETFCAATLNSLLEDCDPPKQPLLLYTIPEHELQRYAQEHNIPIITQAPDDVRIMLDQITKSQPQTYLSLTRSAQRLLPNLQTLRETKQQ